ncbi:MAG: hypothetical protein WC750_01135 [Patescibacteria group bacterium]
MNNQKIVPVLIALIVACFASASCVAHRHQLQGDSPPNQPTPPNAAYPAECQGQAPSREGMMHAGRLAAVKCFCVNGNQAITWWKTVMPDSDPASATFCVLSPGQQTLPEMANTVASNYMMTQQTTLMTETAPMATAPLPALPPLPSVIPFQATTAQPTATATALPSVPPLPSVLPPPAKSELKKFVMYARDVKYECGDGAAKRSYHLVVSESQNGRVEQSVTQECHGDHVVCLTNGADQQDSAKPPCACPSGSPAKVNQQFNIWTCK